MLWVVQKSCGSTSPIITVTYIIDRKCLVRAASDPSMASKTGAESIPMLEKAISALGDDVDDNDYWNATEGNAKRALYGLLAFAKMRPDGVWDGD